jgi:hypothetical protein
MTKAKERCWKRSGAEGRDELVRNATVHDHDQEEKRKKT